MCGEGVAHMRRVWHMWGECGTYAGGERVWHMWGVERVWHSIWGLIACKLYVVHIYVCLCNVK